MRMKSSVIPLAVWGIWSIFPSISYAFSLPAPDSRAEAEGSPSSWDVDLSTPFSITEEIFGFPNGTITGFSGFTISIPNVANPTAGAITAQVYFSLGDVPQSPTDAAHRKLTLNRMPITGCTLTVPPQFNGPFAASCAVSPSDFNLLVSNRIVNTTSTSQSIAVGLGPEAMPLIFASSSNPVSVTIALLPVSCTPAVIRFTVSAPANVSMTQSCSLTSTPEGLQVPISVSGGNWLSGPATSNATPAVLTLTANPTAMSPGIYQDSVTLTAPDGDPFVVPVVLTILPADPQFIPQGPPISTSAIVGGASEGYAVALAGSGNTALIGAPTDAGGNTNGAAWSTNRLAGVWSMNSANDFDSTANEGSSVAVSADGSVILWGGPADAGGFGGAGVLGGPCMPAEPPFVTMLQAELDPIGNAQQGASAALSADGATALVGGPGDNGGIGAAWVFRCSQGSWSEVAKLIGAPAIGASAQGTAVALSADGKTALIGAPFDNNDAGAAFVFTLDPGGWTQQTKLFGSNAIGASAQGTAVALSADGNTALVGGPSDDFFKPKFSFFSTEVGAAWVFTRSASVWSPTSTKLVGGTGDFQAQSVALSADGSLAVSAGASFNPVGAGAAWVFTRQGGSWNQLGSPITGTGAARAVALSADGSTMLLGGAFGNTTEAFVLSGPPPTLGSMSPTQAIVGGSDFTLTVNGSNFLNGSAVQWNEQGLPTNFVSATQLTATVSAARIKTAGSVAIFVMNPDGTATSPSMLTVNAPMLGIVKSHSGNFAKGESNAAYQITVANAAGALPTTGTVTVTESVPTGMTLTSMEGQGWTCPSGGAVCTRSDPLGAGGSYQAITVTVKIAGNAATPLTNQVSVSGGGSASAVANDPTTIVTASPCDVNFDLVTNINDVQMMLKQALGESPAVNNLNGSGGVNLVDVEIVIQAVLHGTCVIG